MKKGFSDFVEDVIHKYEFGTSVSIESMTPFSRGDRNSSFETNVSPRLSAVIVLVYPKLGIPHIVLIERPDYDGVHARQIALPGGKKDEVDQNLKETALRELNEEIGVSSSQVNVIGMLKEIYIPPSGFLVSPFLAFCTDEPVFKADPREVKTIIEVPISLLLDKAIIKKGSVPVGNRDFKITAPYFDVFGHKVWGATAIILNEFKALTR